MNALENTLLNSAGLSSLALRVKRPVTRSSGELPADSIKLPNLGRQAGTTLGAAGFDHLASTNSAHASAKTMITGTLDAARLKGSFHYCNRPVNRKIGMDRYPEIVGKVGKDTSSNPLVSIA